MKHNSEIIHLDLRLEPKPMITVSKALAQQKMKCVHLYIWNRINWMFMWIVITEKQTKFYKILNN